MENYIYIFVIILIVVVVPIAICLVFKPMFQQRKLLNGVVNYDTFMRKFVFQIDFTKDGFYDQLKKKNINDILEYYLNDDISEITFVRYNMKYSYKISLDEFNESIILRVEQIPMVSKATDLINEFFVKKFDAKPIDYQKFGF